MNQRKIMMIGLITFCILLGGFSIFAIKNSDKFQKLFSKPESQWKWDDSWNGHMPDNSSSMSTGPAKPETKPEVKPEKVPESPHLVGNYQEALKVSGETGKPILVFYTAEWCGFCKKMKSETFSKEKVSEISKNYIFVYVDIDHDRGGVGKFGITSLPSFVVTNSKEEKVKMHTGYMNTESFTKWLND